MTGTIRDPSADQDAATADDAPDRRHLLGGVEVEESSGTAFVEASGRAPPGDAEATPDTVREWRGLAVAGASLLALGGGLIARRMLRRPASAPGTCAPVAFSPACGAVDSFDQTRDAGPENMRDGDTAWDEVDEGSDESFPASDPPSSMSTR